jgi:hypothetical protein
MELSGLNLSRFTSSGIWILFLIFPEILISGEQQELKVSGKVLCV